ncbi:MAG: universal stress protein [Deltaproteobacteria bacterium]|nr:universal stress protein [Deltaproteobacteria bacterium]
MFKKIIVAMDFSELSLHAARAAAKLAAGLAAQVTLVHVITPGAEYGSLGLSKDNLRAGIEGKLKEVIATLDSKASIDWGVVDGDPANELATFASRWDGDLIAIGSNARSGIGRVLLGSVAAALVRSAKVPVLVLGPEST